MATVVLLFDAGIVTTYVDGEFFSELDYTPAETGCTTLWIAANPSRNFIGLIDDLRVFERPLTDIGVEQLFEDA